MPEAGRIGCTAARAEFRNTEPNAISPAMATFSTVFVTLIMTPSLLSNPLNAVVIIHIPALTFKILHFHYAFHIVSY
jgi:hypothetical protein